MSKNYLKLYETFIVLMLNKIFLIIDPRVCPIIRIYSTPAHLYNASEVKNKKTQPLQ